MAITNRLADAVGGGAAGSTVEYPAAPVEGRTARRTSVRLDKALAAELSTEAAARGVSITQLVDGIVMAWLGREAPESARRAADARGYSAVSI